jgi:hypothetical protein
MRCLLLIVEPGDCYGLRHMRHAQLVEVTSCFCMMVGLLKHRACTWCDA